MADKDHSLVVKDEHKFLHDRAVTIIVGSGDAKKEFHIHNGLLRERSGYFERLPEGFTIHTLPNESPEIFELYQEYIYTRRIPCKADQKAEYPGDATKYRYEYQDSRLIDLYWLAGTLYDDGAMHAVLRAFLTSFRNLKRKGWPAAPLDEVMKKFSDWTDRESSPLYEMLIDMFFWEADEFSCECTPEYVARDVAKKALGDARSAEHGSEDDRKKWETATCCDYEHDSCSGWEF